MFRINLAIACNGVHVGLWSWIKEADAIWGSVGSTGRHHLHLRHGDVVGATEPGMRVVM